MAGDGVWEKLSSLLGRRRQPHNNNTESQASLSNMNRDDHPTKKLQVDDLASLYIITQDDSKKQCRAKLKKSFWRNRVVMTVTDKDFFIVEERNDGVDATQRERLILPRSEKQYGTSTVPNCCVICLEPYRTGDSVVWSCNSDCQHAMHQACVLKYLVHNQKKAGMTPCCICRCNFTDLEVERGEPRQRRRRGRGGRRTVRTQRNFDALALPSWLISSSSARHRRRHHRR